MNMIKNAYDTAKNYVLDEWALAHKPTMIVIFLSGIVAGWVVG